LAKVSTEELRKVKPLKEGMMEVKQEVIDEVFAVLRRFIDTLHKVPLEEEKLKNIMTKMVRLLKILDSRWLMILRFEAT